jgi:hypothetical protein
VTLKLMKRDRELWWMLGPLLLAPFNCSYYCGAFEFATAVLAMVASMPLGLVAST